MSKEAEFDEMGLLWQHQIMTLFDCGENKLTNQTICRINSLSKIANKEPQEQ